MVRFNKDDDQPVDKRTVIDSGWLAQEERKMWDTVVQQFIDTDAEMMGVSEVDPQEAVPYLTAAITRFGLSEQVEVYLEGNDIILEKMTDELW